MNLRTGTCTSSGAHVRSPGDGVIGGCEQSTWVLGHNLGPLEEQVLLTTEPILSLKYLFLIESYHSEKETGGR